MTHASRPRRSGDLTDIPFFRRLDHSVAEAYGSQAVWLAAAPDELVLDFEDATNDVFFVISGRVRVVVRALGGQELVLTDIAAGSFFGEMAAIDGGPRSASVTALVRTRICKLPGRAFMQLLSQAPELSQDIMRVLVGRIRELTQRLFELSHLDIRRRLHAELLRAAGPPGPQGERVISPPPLQQILAGRVGARREPVSREIARLIREGTLARTRGALIIRKPQALELGLLSAVRG